MGNGVFFVTIWMQDGLLVCGIPHSLHHDNVTNVWYAQLYRFFLIYNFHKVIMAIASLLYTASVSASESPKSLPVRC